MSSYYILIGNAWLLVTFYRNGRTLIHGCPIYTLAKHHSNSPLEEASWEAKRASGRVLSFFWDLGPDYLHLYDDWCVVRVIYRIKPYPLTCLFYSVTLDTIAFIYAVGFKFRLLSIRRYMIFAMWRHIHSDIFLCMQSWLYISVMQWLLCTLSIWSQFSYLWSYFGFKCFYLWPSFC